MLSGCKDNHHSAWSVRLLDEFHLVAVLALAFPLEEEAKGGAKVAPENQVNLCDALQMLCCATNKTNIQSIGRQSSYSTCVGCFGGDSTE